MRQAAEGRHGAPQVCRREARIGRVSDLIKVDWVYRLLLICSQDYM